MLKPVFPILLLTLLLAGCQTTQKILRPPPPPPLPSYHQGEEGLPMRRVALLPLNFDQQGGAAMHDLELVFQGELNKTSAFEIVPLNHQQLEEHFGKRQFSSVEIIPRDLLTRLVLDYGVDGVLFTDITQYFPYRPISIGVRCKLVDARSGQTRWAFDHLFDSGNPAVATAAKQFAVEQSNQQLPIATDGTSMLQSPTRFAKYVAHETYRSLLNK